MSKVTIFTPTFNRGYIIHELYNSLLRQTVQDFEWLIVDDGSTDDTQKIVKMFISEKNIPIRYLRKENGGKHTAVNVGIKEADGELFFIVDSDDQLIDNAIERVLFYYSQIKENDDFAGVCGLKAYFDRQIVGGKVGFDVLDCNSLDYRYKYKIKGDKSEVFKTHILKNYSYPEIDGEKYAAPGFVWNQIACKYILRYFNEIIYLCEYLPDGLSKANVQNRMKYNKMSSLFYLQLYEMPIPLIQKIKAAVNYWRFGLCSIIPLKENIKNIGLFALLLLPVGLFLHFKDKRNASLTCNK